MMDGDQQDPTFKFHLAIDPTMHEEYFFYKEVMFTTALHNLETVNYAENEFVALEDDIFNVTYPKSGTNWLIEILNLIKYKGDAALSSKTPIYERSPWFETMQKDKVDTLTRPRIISSHLPIHVFAKSFFKSKAKIIYTMRNPKDICISEFYYTKLFYSRKNNESFQEHLEHFLQGKVMYSSWFDHVKGWLTMKDDERFFFITYEELLQDLRSCVVRICKFLGQELDDEAIDSVVKHSTFKAMKENKMSNWSTMPSDIMDHTQGSFLRKGVVGDWKNHFTVAQNEYFDSVYQEKMKDFDIKLFWETE